MLKRGLVKYFSRTFTKKQYAFVAPLDVVVPPELVYLTNMNEPSHKLLSKLCVDEVITFKRSDKASQPQEKNDNYVNELYEMAELTVKEFRNTQTEDDVTEKPKKSRNGKSQAKSLIFNTEKHITFDKNLHKLILDYTMSHQNDHTELNNIDQYIENNKNDIKGTLSKLDFYDFNQGYFKGKICRLEGKKVIKVKELVDLYNFDLGTHLLSNINHKIDYMDSQISALKEYKTSNRANIEKLDQNIKDLRELTNKESPKYIFSNINDLIKEFTDNNFHMVEYEQLYDAQTAFNELNDAEVSRAKEIFIESNGILKNLMKKTNFILPRQFMEINQNSDIAYLSHFYNNLVALLISKHVICEKETQILINENDFLLKAEFIKLLLKRFNEIYMTSWLSLDIKNKEYQDEGDKKGGLDGVKEIYEHLKSLHEESSSPSKKLLISKVRKFIEERTINEKVLKVIVEELDKFTELSEHDVDFQNTKNYLDLVTKLPFGIFTNDETDIKRAKNILEKSHFGMDEVKKRILEFLAIGKLKESFVSQKVLCLLGPPGVGKTSIAKSIAECLNRNFVRISLGGENDVSVIKGHRRTYIGSYPGKILNALKQAKSENPVVLLDEVDKLGRSSHKGNVQDVLLEVLDPVQNKEFYDNYFEAPLDLSKVLFLCSANILDGSTISAPLYDRLEVIELSGYTKKEKMAIFDSYLLEKITKKVGLDKYNFNIQLGEDIVEFIIENYAREPGVRGLEKKSLMLMEKIAYEFIKNTDDIEQYKKETGTMTKDYTVTKEIVKEHLGPKIYGKQFILHKDKDLIGFSLGLGYNAYGGSVLTIEVIELPKKSEFKLEESAKTEQESESITIEAKSSDDNTDNKKGSLTVTGSLGKVMKESIEIAYSFTKLFLHKIDEQNDYLDTHHLHIHFPEGASKKDGPSAGSTITTALISIATGKPYNPQFAMTGEISLNGKIMKIGGLREKVLAAKREDVKNVIVPASNKADVEEFKDYIKEGMNFHFVKTYDQIYELLFRNN